MLRTSGRELLGIFKEVSLPANSIGFGAILNTGIAVATRLLAIAINIVVIKILEPGELGLFLGVQAIVFSLSGFCDLGLSHAYRVTASTRQELSTQLLGPTLVVQLFATLIYFIAVSVYIYSAGEVNYSSVAIYIIVGALAMQLPDVLSIDLLIKRDYKKASLLSLLTVCGLYLGAFLAILFPSDIIFISLGYMVGAATRFFVAFYFAGGKKIAVQLNKKLIAQFRIAVPFLFSMLITRAGQYFGIAYILSTQGAHVAGVLGLPIKIYQLMLMISTATTGVILPLLHHLAHTRNYDRMSAAVSKLMGPLWLASALLCGVSVLAPQFIITTISSAEYMQASEFLPILAVAFLFKSISIPAGNLLESLNLQWFRVSVQFVSTCIIVLSILNFYPNYGINAVAVSMLSADMISFVVLWGMCAVKKFDIVPLRIHLTSILLMTVLLIAVSMTELSELLKAIVFVFLYAGSATMLKLWNPSDFAKAIA